MTRSQLGGLSYKLERGCNMAYKQLKLWFDEELARMLAEKIMDHNSEFRRSKFISQIKSGVSSLELKDRVAFIARKLYEEFDEDYETGITIILKILGPENKQETGMFSNFYWVMPLAKYVEEYGHDHFDLSMNALGEITKRNTSEYAIRPYIEKYTSRTLQQMDRWARDENLHLRRLASEGGRPRLPWASKLELFIMDPGPLIPILNQLKDDESKYVQKSVANCINDIFKDNEEIARALIEDWIPGATPNRKWIINHSTRRLRKAKIPWAMTLLKDDDHG